jgi:hypothetical protein
MATHTVSDVMQERMATIPLTIIKCLMFNYKDQPDGCNQEESLNEPVNSSKPTEMEKSYATIISTVLERLSAQR